MLIETLVLARDERFQKHRRDFAQRHDLAVHAVDAPMQRAVGVEDFRARRNLADLAEVIRAGHLVVGEQGGASRDGGNQERERKGDC